MSNDIIELLRELKFKGMAEILPELLTKAERNGWSHQDLLLPLFQEELLYRKERSISNCLTRAKIPWTWTLNSFPFERQPAVDQTMPIRLAQACLVPLDSTMSVRFRKSPCRSAISHERLFLAHCRNLPLARIAG